MTPDAPQRTPTPLFVRLLLGCSALVVCGLGLGVLAIQRSAQRMRAQSAQDAIAAIQLVLGPEAPALSDGYSARLISRGSYADNYEVEASALKRLRQQLGPATGVTPIGEPVELADGQNGGRPYGFDQVVELTLADGRQGRWVFRFLYHDLPLARLVYVDGASPAPAE